MTTVVAGLGTRGEQRLLDAEPGQPVGEVADGLVVGEVGLPHPAGRLAAGDDEPVALLDDGEARVVDRGRPQHDPGGLQVRRRRRGACWTSSAIANDSSRSPSRVAALTGKHLQPARLQVGGDHLGELAGLGHVDLVERHQPRPVVEPAVRRQLGLDRVQVAQRVAARLDGGHVDDVHQDAAPLDVAEELQAEALALAGAGDQARDVGDGVADLTGLDDAEVGHQGGERVVRDLRPGGATARRPGWTCRRSGSRPARRRRRSSARGRRRRRPRARPAARSRGPCGAPRRARRCRARRGRPGRRRRSRPAPTRSASTSPSVPLDDGAVRHRQDQVVAVGAAAVTALAGLAAGGLAVRGVVVVEQRRDVLGRRPGRRRRRDRRCRRRGRRAA